MILHRAEALACEMYRYDEDVVSQGAKTLSVLAATPMVSDRCFLVGLRRAGHAIEKMATARALQRCRRAPNLRDKARRGRP